MTLDAPKMMNLSGAEMVLVKFLRDLFNHWRFRTTREPFAPDHPYNPEDQSQSNTWISRRPPAVVRGFIPLNVSGIIDPQLIPDYPRIVVQAKKSADVFGHGNTESLITINILFGAYDPNPDRQGYRDVLNMFEAARIALWEEQIIGGTIALREPFEFEMQSDYFPYFFGLLVSTWTLPTPDYKMMTTEGSYD